MTTPAAYPRTYRATLGWRIFLIGISFVLGIPSLVGIWYFGSGRGTQTTSAFYAGIGTSFFFAALSVYAILSTLRSKIVLFADRIEIHELRVTHTLVREEIAGWRLNTLTTPGILSIERREFPTRKVSTSWIYKADPELEQWLASFDSLDAKEIESAIDAVANDESLGADEQLRLERLSGAMRLARYLNISGGVLFAWGAFAPRPYELVILLLLLAPWVAALVAGRSSGLMQMDHGPNDAKPSLGILVILPMLALVLRGCLTTRPWDGCRKLWGPCALVLRYSSRNE